MGRYVDGFVIPVPKDRIEDYRKVAEQAATLWKEHGALEYWESVGDDFDAPDMTSFPDLAQTKPDETVVFAWVVYASREARDAANEKIMADPRVKELMSMHGDTPIFDCKRMAYGGFKTIVQA